ncbi:MAG: hypothetical protein K2N36_00835, partial [Ruminiclostridium sp.]|nr:hypothetical protein [Ruminiclostridium sp.]
MPIKNIRRIIFDSKERITMKISNSIQFGTANWSVSTAKSVSKLQQNNAADRDRRFDTFTMTGTDRKKDCSQNTKKLDEKTAELVRSLSEMAEDDETELAFDAYVNM